MMDEEVKIYEFEFFLTWTFNRWKLLEVIYKKNKRITCRCCKRLENIVDILRGDLQWLVLLTIWGRNIYSIYLFMVLFKDIYLGS
jgi:hypothetical protein